MQFLGDPLQVGDLRGVEGVRRVLGPVRDDPAVLHCGVVAQALGEDDLIEVRSRGGAGVTLHQEPDPFPTLVPDEPLLLPLLPKPPRLVSDFLVSDFLVSVFLVFDFEPVLVSEPEDPVRFVVVWESLPVRETVPPDRPTPALLTAPVVGLV